MMMMMSCSSITSQIGHYEILQHLTADKTTVAARNYKETPDTPLQHASSHDFLGVLTALVSNGTATMLGLGPATSISSILSSE